jgi:hypothetical protein
MADDYDRQPPGEASTSGMAIASLVFGLLFCIPFVAPIVAIFLGVLGLRDISRSGGRLKGQGLAIGGLVTGGIGLFVLTPLILKQALVFQIQKTKEATNRFQSAINLKQIGLALQNYHDTYGTFPPAVVYSREGKPLYSWRVVILPLIEEDLLYKQFKLDEPWDSPHNKRLLSLMPKIYERPSSNFPTEPNATHYLVLTGGGALFDVGPNSRLRRLAEIQDGASNTIMVVEATKAVPWTQPEDLPYDPNEPLPALGLNTPTFNVLMADGLVRPLPKDIDEKTLRGLITYNGKEIVEIPGEPAAPQLIK